MQNSKYVLNSEKKLYSLLLECDYQQFSDLQENLSGFMGTPKKTENVQIQTLQEINFDAQKANMKAQQNV